MLTRFCLYGFLKNQRYFEPYFMLAILSLGADYFHIGLLLACQSLTLNVLEVPSGILADRWGRRRCMVASFSAYVASFATFALAANLWWLFPAAVLYGIGDSFRTGTHKAMIFEWLRLNGMEDQRTQVYGLTRSWSKYGSAVSAFISAILVSLSGSYQLVFWWACIPYLANIVNVLTYPKVLDRHNALEANISTPMSNELSTPWWRELAGSLQRMWQNKKLRRLVVESMTWEGLFSAIKDYIQPAIVLAFVLWFVPNSTSDAIVNSHQDLRIVWAIATVYTILSLLSGLSSRTAHRLVRRIGNEERTATWLWTGYVIVLAGLGGCDLGSFYLGVVLAFVLLNMLQNIWRPILVARIDSLCDAQWGATVLSIESQSHRLLTLILAPAIGAAIDWSYEPNHIGTLWPMAAIGIVCSLPPLILRYLRK
ncbi:MAG: MFS transporter [Planctomycetales bacterium]|nr:MFS transporter [Planctomycetales bacterium]